MIFAMPKSSSLGDPSRFTRMFPGFKSRCTMFRSCAYWTAEQIFKNRCRRSLAASELRVAILRDRLAVHVLHDEVRKSLVGGAAVDQARDVAVFEPGENLALIAKPADREFAGRALANQLDGHAFVEFAVGASGQIDRAHAALADLAL